MGTSGSYGGPSNATPLVPTWADSDAAAPVASESASGTLPIEGSPSENRDPNVVVPQPPPNRPDLVPPPVQHRFRDARSDFTRFVSSGGGSRNLGRALSHYVSTATGGSRNAAKRMGVSTSAGAGLLGFLSNVASNGTREALRVLKLDQLVGKSVEEIFLGLADCVCPNTGDVDAGIARSAFIETIVDLADMGVSDLDSLSADQIRTVFELYATHAIESRICNDIGLHMIALPSDLHAAEQVQVQLRDFIRRSVSDSLSTTTRALPDLIHRDVQGFVSEIYESAFAILQSLGEEAGEAA